MADSGTRARRIAVFDYHNVVDRLTPYQLRRLVAFWTALGYQVMILSFIGRTTIDANPHAYDKLLEQLVDLPVPVWLCFKKASRPDTVTPGSKGDFFKRMRLPAGSFLVDDDPRNCSDVVRYGYAAVHLNPTTMETTFMAGAADSSAVADSHPEFRQIWPKDGVSADPVSDASADPVSDASADPLDPLVVLTTQLRRKLAD